MMDTKLDDSRLTASARGLEGPRLKIDFSLIIHGPDHVELRSGGFNAVSHFLRDEDQNGQLAAILKHLDGRSVRDVARETGARRAMIEDLIDHLYQIGAIQDGPEHVLDAYFDRIFPSLRSRDTGLSARMPATIIGAGAIGDMLAASIRELLPDADVAVLGDEDPTMRALRILTLSRFEKGLDRATIEEDFMPLKGRLLILPQLPIDPHRALVLNRLALLLGSPWLWGAADGPTLFVGPLTVPDASACFQCCETRVTMNLRETVSYQRYKSALAEGQVRQAPLKIETALQHILAGHMALEAVNYLVTGTTFTIGKTLSLYMPTMEFCFHDILRLPGCPACGPEAFVEEPELYYDMRALLDTSVGASR